MIELIFNYFNDLYFLIILFIVLYFILMGLFIAFMKNSDKSILFFLFLIIDIIEFALLYKIYLLLL